MEQNPASLGQAGGVAGPLDANGKMPSSQLVVSIEGVLAASDWTDNTIIVTGLTGVIPGMIGTIGLPETATREERDAARTALLRNTFTTRSTGPFPRLLHRAGTRRLAIPRRNTPKTGRFAGRATTP